MATACLLCGASGPVVLHHPTARVGPTGPYLDPRFTVPCCVDCHYAEHAAWRDAGIEHIAGPASARLIRAAWLIGRLADRAVPMVLEPSVLRGLHGCLLAAVKDQEAAA